MHVNFLMHMYSGAINQSCDYFGRRDILTTTNSRLRLFVRCDFCEQWAHDYDYLFVA